jgi:crotonobetainyl-CoA:carnitine CoA-transferase CaiB-like acyl-CoA transferase
LGRIVLHDDPRRYGVRDHQARTPGRGGFDPIAQGMGGIMHVTGEPDGPPTSVGLPICDLGTGMWAVQGILAALLGAPARRQGPARRMLITGERDRL